MPIRQPTSEHDQYAWWREAIKPGRGPARVEDQPHPGWYYRQFKKNGPRVPVRIDMVQDVDDHGELVSDEFLTASAGGQSWDPVKIWPFCRAIPRDEYDSLVNKHRNDAEMAATHVPYDVGAKPTRPPRG